MSASSKLIDRISLAAIAACAVAVGLTLLVLTRPSWRAQFAVEAPPSYEIGETIDLPRAVYSGREMTLAVFADATCSASVRSQSALHLLVQAFAAQTHGRVVLVASNEWTSVTGIDAFANAIGVGAADVQSMDLRPLRLRVVPAAAVLDRDGKVLAFHDGYLTEPVAQALLAGLPGASSGAEAF